MKALAARTPLPNTFSLLDRSPTLFSHPGPPRTDTRRFATLSPRAGGTGEIDDSPTTSTTKTTSLLWWRPPRDRACCYRRRRQRRKSPTCRFPGQGEISAWSSTRRTEREKEGLEDQEAESLEGGGGEGGRSRRKAGSLSLPKRVPSRTRRMNERAISAGAAARRRGRCRHHHRHH